MSQSTIRPIALITGANQGVGLSTANILASQHNYHVIIGARNVEAGEKAASDLRAQGHAASFVHLDLDSESSINAAIQTIESQFGYLDVLINNAGVLLDAANKDSMFQLFTKTMTTNIIGPAHLTDGLIPLLRKAVAQPARIVFVSTVMGSMEMTTDKTTFWYPTDYKAYDASKVALNMVALNYARILDGTGAKVNVVCPGLNKTQLTGFMDIGTSPDVGAIQVVKMATIGEDGPTETFTNRDGPIPW